MRSTRALTMWVAVLATSVIAVMSSAPIGARQAGGAVAETRPEVSLDVAPLEVISPVARDGHAGQAVLRKPPGQGPFPAVVLIHGGLTTVPTELLRQIVPRVALPSRFLAAGYVVAAATYRSRDDDPQSGVSLNDSLAAVEYLRRLPYVDADSVGVYGCSGGGDLALAVAAEVPVAAIVAEEPASMMFTGVWNASSPKAGDRYTPRDTLYIYENPTKYYTPEHQQTTREKIGRMQSPILIVQGDVETPLAVNDFNAAVLIPELRAQQKDLQVLTYPGEPHCFAFGDSGSYAGALEAFEDAEAFFAAHMPVKATRLAEDVVQSVPWRR